MIDKGWDGMRRMNRKENAKLIGKLSAIEETIRQIREMQTAGASI